MSSRSNKNKRARGRPKRSSFANDLDDQTLPAAVTLLRKLDDVDFGNFESQLQPIADSLGSSNDDDAITKESSTLLKECMKFLVLKKIAGDEDAKVLSPTDVIDAVWHQLLLNPRLYKNINEALGGEMIDHNPEGGRDVAARNKRVCRTMEMYKTVFITPAASVASSMWKAPVELPVADDDIPNINITLRDRTHKETMFQCKKTMRVREMLSVVAKQRGVHRSSLRLFLDGQHLPFEDMIGEIVKDGDVIDVLLQQIGC
jgi:hypothetical protein